MKGFRLWLGALCALTLAACGGGGGGANSPDFQPVLKSIAVTPKTASIGTGETKQFEAVGTFTSQPGVADTTRVITTEVNWTSSAPEIATIDAATGIATGAGKGTTTITASRDGVSTTATLTGEGRVLRQISITPTTAVVAPNGTTSYTAMGIYSDSPTPVAFPTGETITWTLAPAALGTLSPNGENVSVQANTTEGEGTLTATVGGVSGTAKFIVGRVTALKVDPATASSPVGIPKSFKAIASFATTSSGGSIADQEVPAVWTATLVSGSAAPSLDAKCASASKPSSTCLVTGKSEGEVEVTASYLTFSDDATLTVTPAVLKDVTIVSLDPNVTISGSDPRMAEIPLGAAPSFRADYTYTDNLTGPARKAADKVTWSLPSSSSIATLSVDSTTNIATVTSAAKGTTTLTASAPDNISDAVQLTVGDAAVQSISSVRPAKAYVAVEREQEFIAVGKFSDGSEADLPDSAVTWTSADIAVATINTSNGVAKAIMAPSVATPAPTTKIRATLKSNTSSFAEADFVVTTNRCTIPLLATDGASAAAAPGAGVCLLCGTNNEFNVVDSLPLSFGQINIGAALLNGYRGIDVTIDPGAPYLPIATGSKPAFIIGLPKGTLVLANLLAQLEINTLMDGNVVESSGDLIPLRIDLLGTTIIDASDSQDQVLVAIDSSLPFNGLRLKLKAGTATALQSVNVFAACANSDPVTPTLTGIGQIKALAGGVEITGRRSQVGTSINFDAFNLAGASIPDADVTWTSSNPSIFTPNANGTGELKATGTVTVTATLKDQSLCTSACSATFTLTVEQNFCVTQFTPANSTATGSVFGICLLCTVTDVANVNDGIDLTAASINLPVGAVGAGGSIRINSTSPTPYPVGQTVGFLVGQPVGLVAKAELLSQISVRTLLDGTVVETFNLPQLLDLDVLGLNLDGSEVLSVIRLPTPTTQPFNGVEFRYSGLLTALSQLKVYTACPSSTPVGD